MSVRTKLPQFLAVLVMAIWLGGFTFYSAVVIPVLHDQLGSPLEAGLVTQRVTDALNLLGMAAVALGVVATMLERSSRDPRFRSGVGLGLLAVTVLCLAVLFYLHRSMDRRLETGEFAGFYPIHRVYLWVSTVQWLANTGLLAWWSGLGGSLAPETAPENSQVSEES
jgi:hypothetical protein